MDGQVTDVKKATIRKGLQYGLQYGLSAKGKQFCATLPSGGQPTAGLSGLAALMAYLVVSVTIN
jgi:hypothetical protein